MGLRARDRVCLKYGEKQKVKNIRTRHFQKNTNV